MRILILLMMMLIYCTTQAVHKEIDYESILSVLYETDKIDSYKVSILSGVTPIDIIVDSIDEADIIFNKVYENAHKHNPLLILDADDFDDRNYIKYAVNIYTHSINRRYVF